MVFEVLKAVSDVIAVVLAVAAMIFAYSRTRDQATQAQLRELEGKVAGLREQQARIQQQLQDTPTSRSLHEVATAITELGGEIKAQTARLEGLSDVVTRLDRVVQRQEDWMLEHGGKA